MYKSYWRIAFRSLWKNKLYTTINLTGLTLGIVSCLLIGLYVRDELTYDRFNRDGDRIVRMVMESREKNGTVSRTAVCGTKAGPQMARTFPEVAAFVRLIRSTGIVHYGDKLFEEPNLLYADSAFFKMFTFPLLEGDPVTALRGPNQVVLTRTLARKYFGSEDPLGKVIRIGTTRDYVVTGVAQDPPGNSQVKFDLVASFSTLSVSRDEIWWTANYTTYLLLHAPDRLGTLQAAVNRYMRGISKTELGLDPGEYMSYRLEPLFDVHLHAPGEGGLEPAGSMMNVLVLSTIALLILVVACVNYTNLATAQSSGRITEIAVRKVLGARVVQLFRQFIGESVFLTGLALLLAILLGEWTLPWFNELTGKSFTSGTLLHPLVLSGLAALGIVVSFLSGAYPAFILSNTRIVRMLRSGFRGTAGGNRLRKALIVFQFVVSVFLIAATLIVLRQLSYIRHKDLGFDREQVVVLPVDGKMHDHYTELKNALLGNPHVLSVSGGYEEPTHIQWGDAIKWDDGHGEQKTGVNAIPVDLDFTRTMGLHLLAGRDFQDNDFKLMTDSAHFRYSFVINERLSREMGWTPNQAIGKTISKNAPGTIVGVVKDFHYASFHEPIGNMAIFLDTSEVFVLFVKITGQNIPGTLSSLEKTWKDWVKHRPFSYSFLDDDFASLYINEVKTAQVFGLFSGLAILLACLGLFALAAYTTVQRTKEIGIRKVLGATLADITFLVSGSFLRLVLAAILLATPLAWYTARLWLQDFVYRAPIPWWAFAAAGLSSLGIAFLTVGYQAMRAAKANPVNSLRNE